VIERSGPRCITEGETYGDALAMAEDCLRGFLEALVKAGQPIPREVENKPALRKMSYGISRSRTAASPRSS
jgi:predicted RNase H-like HicB family nuclease